MLSYRYVYCICGQYLTRNVYLINTVDINTEVFDVFCVCHLWTTVSSRCIQSGSVTGSYVHFLLDWTGKHVTCIISVIGPVMLTRPEHSRPTDQGQGQTLSRPRPQSQGQRKGLR